MNQYRHIDTKEIVRIISDEGNFYVLNNGTKIDKQLFFQKYVSINNAETQKITETINMNIPTIDPIDFLNTPTLLGPGINENLDKLKNIDTSKFIEPNSANRVVIKDLSQDNISNQTQTVNHETKEELLRKYYETQKNQSQVSQYVDENDPIALENMVKNMQKPIPTIKLNENGLTETQEIIRKQQIELTGEDPFIEKIKKFRQSKGYNVEPAKNPTVFVEQNQQNNDLQQNAQNIQAQNIQVEDPTISLFKKFKRNHNISLNLKIKDKISKPDFIKVMADGLDGDIIQFYTDDIFTTFLKNTEGIKTEIYNQIYKNVYGNLPNNTVDDIEDTTLSINDIEQKSEKKVFLVPGKPTKTGKITFKYITTNGRIVDMIPQNAEKKGLKPYIN